MPTLCSVDIKTKKGLHKAMEAFNIVCNFSENELETLEILSKSEDKDLMLCGLEESKNNKIHPIESILTTS
ncbi:MAG: hypothetical protein ABIA02_01565 [Candidatus Falkowbacteria bacterium]